MAMRVILLDGLTSKWIEFQIVIPTRRGCGLACSTEYQVMIPLCSSVISLCSSVIVPLKNEFFNFEKKTYKTKQGEAKREEQYDADADKHRNKQVKIDMILVL